MGSDNDAGLGAARPAPIAAGAGAAGARGFRLGRVWTGNRLIDLVAFILLIAGAAKLLDLPGFEDAIGTWAFVPRWLAPAVALSVPLLEIAVSGAWLLRLAPRAGIAGAGCLLAVFSAALGAHLLFAQPPKCGCFGPIQQFYAGLGEAESALIRNGLLGGTLVAGVLLRRGARPARFRVESDRSATICPAFTLLEVMICVVVIAVVLSLVLPALQHTRKEAQHSVSTSNLRSHVQIFGIYCADYRDAFPYFTNPQMPDTTLRVEARGIQKTVMYFEAFNNWNWGLAEAYYGGDPFQDSFYPPGYWAAYGLAAPPPNAWTGYYYGCSFLSDPLFWNPSSRTDQSQWRATRADEVTYPSRKGLIIAAYPLEADFHDKGLMDFWPDLHATFARVDGSVARVGLGEFLPPMESGDGSWEPQAGYHGSWWFPMLHTFDGVRGRDTE